MGVGILISLCSRIELKMSNGKQATASACSLFCYAVGLCGWVSVWCHCITNKRPVSHWNPKRSVVVSHILSTQPAGAISSCKRSPKKRVQVWNSPLLKKSQPRPPGSSGPWVAYVSVLRRLELDPKELGPIVWSSRRAHRNLKWEKASLTGSWRSGRKPVKWGWVSSSAHWL